MMRRHRSPGRSGETATPDDARSPARVAVLEAGTQVLERLRGLGAEVSRVVPGPEPELPEGTEVAVVVLPDEACAALTVLRGLQRRRPDVRLVVVADEARSFEEAFESGADAYIGLGADDTTLLAALRGRWRGSDRTVAGSRR